MDIHAFSSGGVIKEAKDNAIECNHEAVFAVEDIKNENDNKVLKTEKNKLEQDNDELLETYFLNEITNTGTLPLHKIKEMDEKRHPLSNDPMKNIGSDRIPDQITLFKDNVARPSSEVSRRNNKLDKSTDLTQILKDQTACDKNNADTNGLHSGISMVQPNSAKFCDIYPKYQSYENKVVVIKPEKSEDCLEMNDYSNNGTSNNYKEGEGSNIFEEDHETFKMRVQEENNITTHLVNIISEKSHSTPDSKLLKRIEYFEKMLKFVLLNNEMPKGNDMQIFDENFNEIAMWTALENVYSDIVRPAIQCKLCRRKFKTLTLVISHVFAKHPDEANKFHCHREKHVGKKKRKGRHMEIRFVSDKYLCSECGYSTPHAMFFMEHLRQYAVAKPYTVEKSKMTMMLSDDFIKLLLKHRYYITTPGTANGVQGFLCIGQYLHEIGVHNHPFSETPPFDSTVCMDYFITDGDHNACAVCGFGSDSRDLFVEHVRAHLELYPYTCERCKKRKKEFLPCCSTEDEDSGYRNITLSGGCEIELEIVRKRLNVRGLAFEHKSRIQDLELDENEDEEIVSYVRYIAMATIMEDESILSIESSCMNENGGTEWNPRHCVVTDNEYFCSFCERTTMNRQLFREHVRLHVLDKPYFCVFCSLNNTDLDCDNCKCRSQLIIASPIVDSIMTRLGIDQSKSRKDVNHMTTPKEANSQSNLLNDFGQVTPSITMNNQMIAETNKYSEHKLSFTALNASGKSEEEMDYGKLPENKEAESEIKLIVVTPKLSQDNMADDKSTKKQQRQFDSEGTQAKKIKYDHALVEKQNFACDVTSDNSTFDVNVGIKREKGNTEDQSLEQYIASTLNSEFNPEEKFHPEMNSVPISLSESDHIPIYRENMNFITNEESPSRINIKRFEPFTISKAKGNISNSSRTTEHTYTTNKEFPQIKSFAVNDRVVREKSLGARIPSYISNKSEIGVNSSQDGSYYCPQCFKTFDRCSPFRRHMMMEFNYTPFSCPLCDFKGTKSNQLMTHIRKKHPEEPTATFVYKRDNELENKLKTLIKTVRGKGPPRDEHSRLIRLPRLARLPRLPFEPLSCKRCALTFLEVPAFEHHVMQHLGYKPFACSLCCARRRCRKTLAIHLSMVHGNDSTAQMVFKESEVKASRLREAVTYGYFDIEPGDDKMKAKKTAEKPRGDSQSTPKDEDPLLIRSDSDTEFDEESLLKTLNCVTCRKIFPKRENFKKHIFAHLGYKPYTCTLCSYVSTNGTTVRHHIRNVHWNDSTVKCVFHESKEMERKVKAIMNEETFEIRYADDHLKAKYACAVERQYGCALCGKRFFYLSSLKAHLVSHYKLFACSRCDVTFASQVEWRAHTIALRCRKATVRIKRDPKLLRKMTEMVKAAQKAAQNESNASMKVKLETKVKVKVEPTDEVMVKEPGEVKVEAKDEVKVTETNEVKFMEAEQYNKEPRDASENEMACDDEESHSDADTDESSQNGRDIDYDLDPSHDS